MFAKEAVVANDALIAFEPVATVRLKVVPSPSVNVITLSDTEAVSIFANARDAVVAKEELKAEVALEADTAFKT